MADTAFVPFDQRMAVGRTSPIYTQLSATVPSGATDVSIGKTTLIVLSGAAEIRKFRFSLTRPAYSTGSAFSAAVSITIDEKEYTVYASLPSGESEIMYGLADTSQNMSAVQLSGASANAMPWIDYIAARNGITISASVSVTSGSGNSSYRLTILGAATRGGL